MGLEQRWLAGWALAGASALILTLGVPAPDASLHAGDAAPAIAAADEPAPLAAEFAREVVPQLHPPPAALADYAQRLEQALRDAQALPAQPEFVVLVDRSPAVQALMIWWGGDGTPWRLTGAAAVSTGWPGRFEHFATPTGLFVHTLANPDFRAEGTKNDLGIRGYGRKGARVFDFGWVGGAKGWGDHGTGQLRLQLHATDPDLLEQRLGSAQSKGCIRTTASLNEFLDRHAILDGDYDRALAAGRSFWVLRKDRAPTAWSGRLLLVVDSQAAARPDWAPWPTRAGRRAPAAAPPASAASVGVQGSVK